MATAVNLFSSCRGTGADLPILSNEAMASQWKHSLISRVYLRSGRPNCTLKAVVSNSGQKSLKRFHMVDTIRLCRVWSCLPSHQFVPSQSVYCSGIPEMGPDHSEQKLEPTDVDDNANAAQPTA